jgi:hypothetical protein
VSLRLNSQTLRLNPGWPNPSAIQKRIHHLTLGFKGEDAGTYQVGGTIKVDGSPDTPVARLVVLFDQMTLRYLQSTWSNATTGAYQFTHLANKPYMVMSFDYTLNFRAIVADRVTPEPMP